MQVFHLPLVSHATTGYWLCGKVLCSTLVGAAKLWKFVMLGRKKELVNRYCDAELQNVSSKDYSRHWTKAKCTTPWAGRRVLHPDAWKWNQHVPAAVLKSVAQQIGLVLQAVAQDVLVVYSCWYVPPITWKSSNSAKRCNVYYHLEDVETIKLSGRTAPCVLIFLHLW